MAEKHAAVSTATFTRPSNATAYTAGDVVGPTAAALTFWSISPNGGPVMITSAVFSIDRDAIKAGETSYTLHLYSVSPPSALGDNIAWDLPAGDRASYLGSISLGTPVDIGTTSYIRTDNINAQFHPSGAHLYGYLVTAAGYTPDSAGVYNIALHTVI